MTPASSSRNMEEGPLFMFVSVQGLQLWRSRFHFCCHGEIMLYLGYVCYTYFWANSLVDCQRCMSEAMGFYAIQPSEVNGAIPKQPQLGDKKCKKAGGLSA